MNNHYWQEVEAWLSKRECVINKEESFIEIPELFYDIRLKSGEEPGIIREMCFEFRKLFF